ncbi:DUF305 domain-containing protein [Nonomuraea candida]|uniref:DUF305 domain-containing protein n=1 Tax=Nonomuraea candida TaxID=359159 RepID=UPI0006932104|nr:DUF305 domain-containing protein [Nonomuraea candida]
MRWVLAMVLVAVLLGCAAKEEPPGATAPAAGVFTTTDVAWLQLADALHTRALPMLGLARERAGSRSLADLAARLGRAHRTGRERLRALLVRARVTGENPHTTHDMPGMPTARELKALAELRGVAFDRRFTALSRAYLEQLVLVAEGERASGGAAEARALAAEMSRAHAAELRELTAA